MRGTVTRSRWFHTHAPKCLTCRHIAVYHSSGQECVTRERGALHARYINNIIQESTGNETILHQPCCTL